MAGATYRVLDRGAPRRAADPLIGSLAERMRDDVEAHTPRRTGRLAGGWRVQRGVAPAVRVVTNSVPYARFVEYGTVHMRAQPMLGPVAARVRGRA